jgi:hypothetical protein
LPLKTRIANTFSNQITENIFYLHIPKCGGVSVGQAIASKYLSLDFRNDKGIVNLNAPLSRQVIEITEGLRYPDETDDDYLILSFREKLLLYYMSQSNSKFISGHFPFSEGACQQHGEKFKLVTVVRDPVKRWISSYFFNRFKADDHMKVRDELEVYVDSHFGISQGYELVKFIGEANKEGDYTSYEVIERAKDCLKRFSVIGFLEDLDDFVKNFEDRFLVNLQIEKKNKNPASKDYQESVVSPGLLEKISAICQPDIEVYEFASNLHQSS